VRTTGHYLMEVEELTTSPLTLAPSCAHPEVGSEPQGCDQPYRTIPPLAFQALGVVFRNQSSGSTPPGSPPEDSLPRFGPTRTAGRGEGSR
jgi:hypothetical protein